MKSGHWDLSSKTEHEAMRMAAIKIAAVFISLNLIFFFIESILSYKKIYLRIQIASIDK